VGDGVLAQEGLLLGVVQALPVVREADGAPAGDSAELIALAVGEYGDVPAALVEQGPSLCGKAPA